MTPNKKPTVASGWPIPEGVSSGKSDAVVKFIERKYGLYLAMVLASLYLEELQREFRDKEDKK